ARGSCRALKWMALAGMVFALGAGSAAAQVTITGPAMDTVAEGMDAEYTVTVKGFVAAGATADTVVVTLETPAPVETPAATAGDPEDISGNSVLSITLDVSENTGTAAVPFEESGTIRVRTAHDDDAEDEKFTLVFAVTDAGGLGVAADDTALIAMATGDDAPPAALTIVDDEMQAYLLTEDDPGDAKEGTGAIELTLTTRHPVEDSSVMLTLSDNGGSDWALDTDTDTAENQDTVTVAHSSPSATAVPESFSQPVTLTHNDGNDGNRVPDTVTVTVYSGGVADRKMESSLSVVIADEHSLPMLGADLWEGDEEVTGMVDEGKEYTVRVFPVDDDGEMTDAAEAWTVTLMGSGSATPDDYTLAGMAEIAMGAEMTGSASLNVTLDQFVDEGETLVVMGTVKGRANTNGSEVSESMTLLTLTIGDQTMKQVWAKSETEIDAAIAAAKGQASGGDNPGENFSLMGTALFDTAEGFTAIYAAESSDDSIVGATSDGSTITISPKMAGMATVTVEATAEGPAGATTRSPQTRPNTAAIMFTVTVAVAEPVLPGMPTNLMATAGDGQVMLSWEAPTTGDTPTGYDFRSGVDDRWSDWAATSSMTGHMVSGLENGKEHAFEVRARNDGGPGPAASAMATPIADPVAPGAPQNLEAMAGDAQVTLSWDAPASGDAPTWYQYRVSTGGVAGEWMRATSDSEQTVTGLTNGTPYTFEVRGVNDAGPGAAATTMATPMAPVDPVAPSAPQNLTATAGDGQVMLAWTAPESGDAPTGYEYRKSAGGIADDWMATSSDTGQTVTGLVNATAYTFEVRARNAGGAGPAASVMATPMAPVDPVAPSAPQNLTATAGDGQVMLAWTAPESGDTPTGYEYHVMGAGVTGNWMTTSSTATTHTVTGLTNGTEYTFQVRAMNAAGTGPASTSATATPMAPDPGVQVTVKSVSAATSVPESGGLEVTVVATVPAGQKVNDKVAPIASRTVMVSFPTDDASIKAGEDADEGEVTPLGATGGAYTWTNITRTDKDSEQTYKFRVAIGQDLDAENEKFQIEVRIDGASKKSKVITIDDAQEQDYVLSLPSAAKGAVKEGGSETLTLEAKPERTIDISFTLALNPNDPTKYTLGTTSGMFGMDSTSTTISAKADGNRDDDTVTVTAYTSGTLGNDVEIASLDITITDANALPMVKAEVVDKDGKALDPQPESVMEGETVKVKLTVVDKDGKAAKAAEKLSISLMPTGMADGQDYRLSTHPIEIASDKESSAVVDLMVTEDSDVGDETLTFSAVVGGES
ncbi:MAG: fibronectin type III domain-containing protein, partial [Gemmatimonadetes bacterium]|nr:fibronectin type III domain-containing protein [Gemmatimonadota bacterium]